MESLLSPANAILEQGKRCCMADKVEKSDAEWQAQLTSEQFGIARKKGTERAFTGEYWNEHRAGTYACVCCGQELFSSDTKYDSGSGWPSFYQPIAADRVDTRDRPQLFHEAYRGVVQPLRSASRPCL